MADDRLPKRAAESRKEVQDKTREANAEMGGLCSERCEEDWKKKTPSKHYLTGPQSAQLIFSGNKELGLLRVTIA